VPAVVRRIVDGWSRRLGDEALATQCWMTLHGCVAMALDDRATLALLRAATQPSHAPVPRPARQPRPSMPLTPVVVLSNPPEPIAQLDETGEPVAEDVVLL
jgi:hypothetical protein